MFVEQTSSACSVSENGRDYISGVWKKVADKNRCESKCRKYTWCIGIMIGSYGNCRLLTKVEPGPIPGWTADNFGNWAEPDQWKNGALSSYKCYEKIILGMYPIIKLLARVPLSYYVPNKNGKRHSYFIVSIIFLQKFPIVTQKRMIRIAVPSKIHVALEEEIATMMTIV